MVKRSDFEVIEGGGTPEQRLEALTSRGEPPSRDDLVEMTKLFDDFSLPFLPLYVGDMMGDTTILSPAEMGAYCRLLFTLWKADCKPLPKDPVKLARIAGVQRGWKAIWEGIERYFQVDERGVWNRKLEKTWRFSTRSSLLQRRLGRQGGLAKALKYNKPEGSQASAAVGSPALATQNPEELPNGNSIGPVNDKKTEPKKTRKKRSKTMPEDWAPDLVKARALMEELELNRQEMNYCYQRMKDHAQQTDRKLVNWDAGFANWVRKARQDGEVGPGSRGRQNGTGDSIFPDKI